MLLTNLPTCIRRKAGVAWGEGANDRLCLRMGFGVFDTGDNCIELDRMSLAQRRDGRLLEGMGRRLCHLGCQFAKALSRVLVIINARLERLALESE